MLEAWWDPKRGSFGVVMKRKEVNWRELSLPRKQSKTPETKFSESNHALKVYSTARTDPIVDPML